MNKMRNRKDGGAGRGWQQRSRPARGGSNGGGGGHGGGGGGHTRSANGHSRGGTGGGGHHRRGGGPKRGPALATCPMCGQTVPDLGAHIRSRHDDPDSHPRD